MKTAKMAYTIFSAANLPMIIKGESVEVVHIYEDSELAHIRTYDDRLHSVRLDAITVDTAQDSV